MGTATTAQSQEEQQLITAYRACNEAGRQHITEYATWTATRPEYQHGAIRTGTGYMKPIEGGLNKSE